MTRVDEEGKAGGKKRKAMTEMQLPSADMCRQADNFCICVHEE